MTNLDFGRELKELIAAALDAGTDVETILAALHGAIEDAKSATALDAGTDAETILAVQQLRNG